MRRLLTSRARGQALIETAVALPAFLIVMFGVVWALQTGVLGERLELVARYGGMVSSEVQPYEQYSLYAAYSSAFDAPITVPCASPPPGLLTNAGPLDAPATQTQTFFAPSASSVSASPACGKVIMKSTGIPMLLGNNMISVSAATDIPPFLQALMGGQTARGTTLNHFASPDMSTLVGCYSELKNAFQQSIDPTTDPTMSTPVTPDLLQPVTTWPTGALVLSTSCSSS